MPATIDGRRMAVRGLSRDGSTHAGLWLDKYLPALRLPDGEGNEEPGTALRALLEEAASAPVPEGYRAAVERRRALIEALDGGVEGGVTRLFTTEANGRIVVGLGAQAIRETNIALLHTWGVPFLPGSALKGLASAAAHGLSADAIWKKPGDERNQGADHALLFGDEKHAGCVVFHDAWWNPAPNDTTLPLDLDVMTVHHADYYRDGSAPPADWDEPTPIPFLTARGKYLVALSGPDAWVQCAAEWLALGLQHLGIGAKTQAGYGRMSLSPGRTRREIEESTLREEHKARLAMLSNLPAQHKGAGTAKQHIQNLREAIEAGAPPADVYAIARALYRREPKFWRGWVKDGRRTDAERAFVEASEMLHEEPAGRSR
jgi:CRISPR-associated protein Cmr6